MESKPLVSVCVQTYNQEKYIGQCLEGIVSQQTTFPFEILVHEDASTDGTAAVVREYEKRYPELMKPIYQTENQFSKINILRKIQFPRVQGKYVAICEGDDYWTDPHKLQRQVDFLESHPNYVMAAENGNRLYLDSGNLIPIETRSGERTLGMEDLVHFSCFQTASVMFCASCVEGLINLKYNNLDILMWSYLGTRGKVHYDATISSVYRVGCGIHNRDIIWWGKKCLKYDYSINHNLKLSRKCKKLWRESMVDCFRQGFATACKRHLWRDSLLFFNQGILPNLGTVIYRNLMEFNTKYRLKESLLKFNNALKPQGRIIAAPGKSSGLVAVVLVDGADNALLAKTMKCLSRQKVKADRVIVCGNMAAGQEELALAGLEYRRHDKLSALMNEFRAHRIVVLSAGNYIPNNLFGKLLEASETMPDTILAGRVTWMSKDADGNLQPEEKWLQNYKSCHVPRAELMANFAWGALFPRGFGEGIAADLESETALNKWAQTKNIMTAKVFGIKGYPYK